jgi:hypothetical protein
MLISGLFDMAKELLEQGKKIRVKRKEKNEKD